MRLYIGADHAGYSLKENLKDYVATLGHEVTDLGTFNEDSIDYPDIAREVAEKVYENEGSLGILVCGSGTGMCMAANKHVGIRAGAATNPELARLARAHNNANVLCLGQRVLDGSEAAHAIVKAFLDASFEGGRHERRVQKMSEMEGGA